MVAIVFTLLLGIQVSKAKSECCASKTVGTYSYTLIETNDVVPDECLNPCTYTRDDRQGSRYCFAKGSLPVKCNGECYPGPPGPTGCPPDENLRIINEDPNSISSRPTTNDCWDYCRALYLSDLHDCFAWTYHKESKVCYTYDSMPICYQTIYDVGWVSGSVCLDQNTDDSYNMDQIPGNATKNIPRYYKVGPFGGNIDATSTFNDKRQANGNVTAITMHTSPFGSFSNIIVGITVEYGGRIPLTHGVKGNKNFVCGKLTLGNRYGEVTVFSTPKSFIFELGFITDGGDPIPNCLAGSNKNGIKGGGPLQSSKYRGTVLAYVSGATTQNEDVLGLLNLFYRIPNK